MMWRLKWRLKGIEPKRHNKGTHVGLRYLPYQSSTLVRSQPVEVAFEHLSQRVVLDIHHVLAIQRARSKTVGLSSGLNFHVEAERRWHRLLPIYCLGSGLLLVPRRLVTGKWVLIRDY